MTRTRTYAFIAAAAALIAFPVAAPAVADQLKRESATVDGRPVPTTSDDDGANVDVPPAPGAELQLAKLDAVEAARLEQLQAKLEFMQQYEQLRADAQADAAAPPAPVDGAADASQRVAP